MLLQYTRQSIDIDSDMEFLYLLFLKIEISHRRVLNIFFSQRHKKGTFQKFEWQLLLLPFNHEEQDLRALYFTVLLLCNKTKVGILIR